MGRSIRRVLLPLSSAALLTLAGCSTQPRWDAEGFHNWLEQQLSAGLNHPVELGPLLGFGLQGLEFGPTRVLPSASDGSAMSVERLTLLPDLIGSVRQASAVAKIGLGNLQLQLQRNGQGRLWTFPQLSGKAPPRLRLKLHLLDAAQFSIDGARPWRFTAGSLDLNLATEQLRFAGAFRPKGLGPRQTQLAMRVQNRWGGRPVLDLRLQMRRLSLPALGSLAAAWPTQLSSGEASGVLRLNRQGQQWRCQGPLQLKQLRIDAFSSPQQRWRCGGTSLELKTSPWRWDDRRGDAAAKLSWRGAPWRSLSLQRLQVRSGTSRLLAEGQLRPDLELKLNSLQLDPSWLGLAGQPLMARGQGRDGVWRLQLEAPELTSAIGSFGLRGTADARWGSGDPLLELDSQLELKRLGSAAPPVAIQPLTLAVQREAKALVFKGDARLDALSPVKLQGRWSDAGLKAELSIEDLPLQRLDPELGGELAGRLNVEGKAKQPKVSARFSLLQPSVAGLQSPELWQGRWQPGSLRLSSASTQVVARLKDNRLQSLQAVKGDGSISVVPSGGAYRWAARRWDLAPLQLGLRGNRPLPLNGVLEGGGRLGLDPLLLQGQASVSDPALAWIKGRQLQLNGFLRYPGFDFSAQLLPQGSGSVQLSSRGAWNGPLNLQAEARKLQPGGVLRLLQDLRRPAAQRPDGRASDLGSFAIDTLGASLDAQIKALQEAQARLALERPAKGNDGRIPLADVEGLMDADLKVQGPSPERLQLELAARGHLWLRGDDRDTALQLEPFVAEINGPLGSGEGSFSFAGLPLGFMALLTPVPAGLRGALRGTGQWQIGLGLPTFSIDLGLDNGDLAGEPLELERGRLELDGRVLNLDLSIRGGQAKNSVDLAGRIPLDPVEDGFELRVSSRGDGLVFLTSLAGGQLQWQSGSIDLQLLIRGTLASPLANGFLRVRDGAVVVADQAINGVEATAFFDFEQLQLESFSAHSGEGRIEGTGSLALSQERNEPGLRFAATAFPIKRPDAQLQADGELLLQGSLRKPALGGELKLSDGLITVSAAELSSGGSPGRPVNTAMPELDWDFQQPVVVRGPQMESADGAALRSRVPSLGPLEFRNLRVGLGPKLRIASPPVADFQTSGLLTLNGPAGPDVRLSGVVKLLKGRVSLLTNVLKLDSSNANVAVFTPSLGLLPYLDVVFTTRVSDRVGGSDGDQLVSSQELQGNFSNLDRLNLIKVIISYAGPADRLSFETLSLRSQPPLPQERLVALLAGNSLAGVAAANAGTAVATLLGGTLLSPVIGGFSNLFDDRITASLYPAYLEPYVQDSGKDSNKGRIPSQLVLGAEVGVDLTDRFNFSVLAAPNRSDIPPEAVLRYQATEKLGVQGALDQQGRWQGQLQLFFRF